MNKGCLIAAIVAAALLLLCGIGAVVLGPKFAGMVGPALLAQMEMDIAQYKSLHPDTQIDSTNEAWATALSSPDSGVQVQKQWAQLVASGNGKLIDLYHNPVRIVANADGTISVISNGKDGLPDTADDETSAKAKEMLMKKP